MPNLIYLCEPKPESVTTEVYLRENQISPHSIETLRCINQIPTPSYNVRIINTHFAERGTTGPNFYLALLHTLLISETNDVVLCNMDIEYSTIHLPIVFDKLIFDMCTNLMSRNITVVLSASNSKIDINAFINSVNVVPSNFYFIEDLSGNCVNSQNNPSAIIASGTGGNSNFGSIVDCYFPNFSANLTDSSAGAAWAAQLMLQMQEYSFIEKGHYLKSKKVKELISSIRPNEPNWPVIRGKINNLPSYTSPNLFSSPYT